MFEVLLDQPRTRQLSFSADVQGELNSTSASIVMSSGLTWGEHCTECAWPTCYSTCSLYTPRADLNCRRFEEGIVPVAVVGDEGKRAMLISFRQWGKLEAHERVQLSLTKELARLERGDAAVRTALRLPIAPHRERRRAGYLWSRYARKHLRPLGQSPVLDDVFLIEAVNEGRKSVAFTLTILDEGQDGRFFQHGFELTPGYNRLLLSTSQIAAHVDLDRPVFLRVEPTRIVPGNNFVFLVLDFARLRETLPARGGHLPPGASGNVKCVVWDLDDTVWRGTLIEDGPEGVEVRPEVRGIMEVLDSRGILQSVASKNNPVEGWAALERAGLADLILHPHIGWGPKSDSMAAIAAVLNIGIDSLLLIDDQPFERAEVQAAHPSVRVADAALLTDLLDRPDLDVPVTAESGRRRRMYKEESQRAATLGRAPSDFEGFLRSCNIMLRLTAATADTAERIYELSQRTNQLNYSGDRLERDQVLAIVRGDGPVAGVVLSVSDRFGDYGIIGCVTIDRSTFTITNFFMSCRVQRKRVEDAFFSRLLAVGQEHGIRELRIRHRATARNGPAVEVLQSLGATPTAWPVERLDEREEVLYTMPCSLSLPAADIVSVTDEVLLDWK